MDIKLTELLIDLAGLIEKHGADLYYTTDDDGIHVSCGGVFNSVCIGHVSGGDATGVRKHIPEFKPRL